VLANGNGHKNSDDRNAPIMRRRSWVLAALIPLLLVGGEVAYWRIAVERLNAGFRDWLAMRAADGWVTKPGSITTGGWPLAATLHIADLTLLHDGPAMPGKFAATANGLDLSLSLLNPATLHVILTGSAHLRAAGAQDVVFSGDEVAASIRQHQPGPLSVTLHADRMRLQPATGAWHLTAGLLNAQADIADDPPSLPAATFTLSAEAIALPEGAGIKWPLGPNISSLSANGRLNGPNPAASDMTRWAEQWRDGGGSLEITHLAMGWGPLGLTSSATLALDDQLQPMGSGNGRIVNYAEALDRLAVAGVLTRSAATAAKAILSLMAGTTAPDEPSTVDVPLTLQYRTLSMRQVPLVRLPELDWPAR
jgi:hypothetical protein